MFSEMTSFSMHCMGKLDTNEGGNVFSPSCPFLSVLFPASLLSFYLGTNRSLGSNKALSI